MNYAIYIILTIITFVFLLIGIISYIVYPPTVLIRFLQKKSKAKKMHIFSIISVWVVINISLFTNLPGKEDASLLSRFFFIATIGIISHIIYPPTLLHRYLQKKSKAKTNLNRYKVIGTWVIINILSFLLIHFTLYYFI